MLTVILNLASMLLLAFILVFAVVFVIWLMRFDKYKWIKYIPAALFLGFSIYHATLIFPITNPPNSIFFAIISLMSILLCGTSLCTGLIFDVYDKKIKKMSECK
jgi:uncharacterized membrane protein YesL